MLLYKATSPLITSSCRGSFNVVRLGTGGACTVRGRTEKHSSAAWHYAQSNRRRLSSDRIGCSLQSDLVKLSQDHKYVGLRSLSSTTTRREDGANDKPELARKEPEGSRRLLDSTKDLQQRMKQRFSAISTHENIYTIPNILTVTRLIAAPAVGYLILHDQHAWAVALFAYAGITDLVDGWMARKWNLQTVVGSVIDPMADKALMTIVVVCLAIQGGLPLWLATIILGRDVSLGIAAIYYRYASLPAPKTFMRYWDFSLPSAEVHPTGVSKFNTFLQLVLIGAALSLPALSSEMTSLVGLETEQLHTAFTAMQYVVAGTTLWSGGSYVWRKDVVKILGTDEALKKKQGFRGRAILGASLAVSLVLAGVFATRQQTSADEASEGKRA